MSDTTSKQFRKALANAIKYHVEANDLNGVSASKIVGCANSRMSQIIRGEVDKISSDALIDVLAKFGYRLSTVIGSTDGHEFSLCRVSVSEDCREALGVSVNEMYEIGEISIAENGDVDMIEESDPDADRVIADA